MIIYYFQISRLVLFFTSPRASFVLDLKGKLSAKRRVAAMKNRDTSQVGIHGKKVFVDEEPDVLLDAWMKASR